MSILIFLAVLFVLVLVHELGHFAVAKWTGMRVDEFGIGFPPKLFGVKKGETEYTFNLFPVGGFVKIYGEDGIGDPSARKEHDGDSGRAFTSKNRWAQAAVLIAGVTMNVLFAWLLIAIAFGTGVRSVVPESEAGPQAELVITAVLPDGPAAAAGLPAGVTLTSVEAGGETLDSLTPSTFTDFIEAHAGEEHRIVYTEGGESHTIHITPSTDVIEASPDQIALGIGLAQVDVVKRGFFASIQDSFIYVLTALRDITVGLTTLLVDAVTFRADLSQVAGPVGIVGLVDDASTHGIATLLMFTAFISLNLAVINIFPFPALDGGRLLFVGIEAVKGSPIRPQVTSALNALGFLLLILLMVAVTWNDIARLV